MTTATWTGRAPKELKRADNVETAPRISEDWLSLIIGLSIFVLSLAAIVNVDLLGWVVTTAVWVDFSKALGTVSKSYASLGGFGALVATYVALLAVLSAAAVALKIDIKKFALSFTAVFWIAYASWIVGNFATFAAVTPADLQKFGISWSLRLTNEGAYILALLVGLVIANVFPRFADAIKDAVRPELYIKIAIVILGGFFAVTAAGKLSLASSLLLRGVAAIIEAYLIYWAVVYFVARKWFGFNREWAAPLASGISICGVSAAIATGASSCTSSRATVGARVAASATRSRASGSRAAPSASSIASYCCCRSMAASASARKEDTAASANVAPAQSSAPQMNPMNGPRPISI